MKKEPIYFDNNGTTPQCKKSIDTVYKWMKVCANPSSTNKQSVEAKKLIEDGKKYILKHCGVNQNKYTVIFTSGGSESNSFILRSTAAAYYKAKKIKPHIITSSIEHNSILDCCKQLVDNGLIECTKIKPNIYGLVDPIDVFNSIKDNTCLISIMFSNNEIGSINKIKQIGHIAHSNNIPFHTDAVQIFGKYKINLSSNNIDALSLSFHKLYAPKGIGAIIINNEFINGYKLESIINGTQQGGLRGGTENIPYIAGAIAGMKCNFENRTNKNKKILTYRNTLLDELNKYISVIYYDTYLDLDSTNINNRSGNISDKYFIILFGPHRPNTKSYVENTVLLSVVSPDKPICNKKLKADLEKQGVIVSLGSACSEQFDKTSHVLAELNVSDMIVKGTIRISFGDCNTIDQVKKFIKMFITSVNIQIPLIEFIKKNKCKNIDKILSN